MTLSPIWLWILPPVMLVASNAFMTLAWYGHLKHPGSPLVYAIAFSWLVALAEYCLAVPANRLGHAVYTLPQLKAMQEVITLVVFAVFSTWYFKEPLGLNQGIGFALIAAGAWFVFRR